jgi:copper chaperone CopZ
MKKFFATLLLALFNSIAHAEYKTVDMTVFGMDCAPCAHAVHVSVKGIQGVNSVAVDLNTGLVAIRLAPGNTAGMRQIEEAIEKNGFTHKGAIVTVSGKLTGSAAAPILEVTGTNDHYALHPAGQPLDLSALIGKTVEVQGTLPQAAKGKVPDSLRYKSIEKAN